MKRVEPEWMVCNQRHSVSVDYKIATCGWCNEMQIGGGDLEMSYHTGCEFCDGHSGWTKDD